MKTAGPDWTSTRFVDSFAVAELVFPQGSVIGLHLHDSAAAPGQPGHRDLPFRFCLTSARARALAEALLAGAAELDGSDAPRQ
jgi:hypothetical protein